LKLQKNSLVVYIYIYIYIYIAQQVVDQGASARWRGRVGRVKNKVNPNVGQE
jgi:hypothetical protein